MSIKNAYAFWAEQYDSQPNKTRDMDARVSRVVLADLPFTRVLELGSGTGKNTEFLLQKTSSITCMDFSEEMMAVAKSRFKQKDIIFINASVSDKWSVEDHSKDLITSSLILEHIADLDFVFAEATRVLKKKGYFWISELHPFKQYSGSKARIETPDQVIEIAAFTHHVSEYLQRATAHGFRLLQLEEWFDDGEDKGLPRLLTLLLQKK